MTILQKNIKQIVIEREPIGVKCDICKENIEPFPKVYTDMNGNKYLEVHYFSCTKTSYPPYENGFSQWDYEICPNCLDKWIKDAKKFLFETDIDDDPSFCVNLKVVKIYPEDNEF